MSRTHPSVFEPKMLSNKHTEKRKILLWLMSKTKSLSMGHRIKVTLYLTLSCHRSWTLQPLSANSLKCPARLCNTEPDNRCSMFWILSCHKLCCSTNQHSLHSCGFTCVQEISLSLIPPPPFFIFFIFYWGWGVIPFRYFPFLFWASRKFGSDAVKKRTIILKLLLV